MDSNQSQKLQFVFIPSRHMLYFIYITPTWFSLIHPRYMIATVRMHYIFNMSGCLTCYRQTRQTEGEKIKSLCLGGFQCVAGSRFLA